MLITIIFPSAVIHGRMVHTTKQDATFGRAWEVVMKGRGVKSVVRMGLSVVVVLACSSGYGRAAEFVHEGMADPGKWTTGMRVGPSFITQQSLLDTTGPALNL